MTKLEELERKELDDSEEKLKAWVNSMGIAVTFLITHKQPISVEQFGRLQKSDSVAFEIVAALYLDNALGQ